MLKFNRRLVRECKNVLFGILIFVSVSQTHNVYERTTRETQQWCRDAESYLISTPGCTIPNYMATIKFDEAQYMNQSCPTRIVYVNKITNYLIRFHISWPILKVVYKVTPAKPENFCCFYQFIDLKYLYSKSKPFKDEQVVTLKEEMLSVTCIALGPKRNNLFLYKDYYLLLKKKVKRVKIKPNEKGAKNPTKWNVLLLGIDTMSRARAYNSLPKTIKYLQSYDWLDFRAFSKVGFRTFENVFPLLTGMAPVASTYWGDRHKALEKNAHRFIWNRFKKAGYMTAYGEAHMETLGPFHILKPTDHFVRPFKEESWRGNYVCTGSMFPERHLFDYILQYVRAYHKEPFFGFFYSNSFSHDFPASPALLDKRLIEFLEEIRRTKSSNRTFAILFSDHGVTYGKPRNDKQKEFYYEERLPMLFIKVPEDFKETFPDEYFNMQWNQNRLTSVYDLHATLMRILSLSISNSHSNPPEACPSVTGLTEKISSKRTCKDACIHEIWCTCQCLVKAGNTWISRKSLNLAVSHVQRLSLSIKTDEKCTKCAKLIHKKTNRIHYYIRGNKTWYIVNFAVSPGDKSFEAVVLYDGEHFTPSAIEITKAMVDQTCVNAYDKKVYCECITAKC